MGGKVPPGITQNQADARYNIAASQTIDVTSHATTITDTEGASALLVFSGTLSSNQTYQLPSGARVQRIANNTTGDYVLKVKRGAGGTAYNVIQGETLEII